jgi:hypothetical protein
MQARFGVAGLLDRVHFGPQVIGAQEIVGDPQPSGGITL